MIYVLSYCATICFVVTGAVLGLVGVWWPRFWYRDIGGRLIATDLILAASSLIVALITRFIGGP